jgi:hypothetical protein
MARGLVGKRGSKELSPDVGRWATSPTKNSFGNGPNRAFAPQEESKARPLRPCFDHHLRDSDIMSRVPAGASFRLRTTTAAPFVAASLLKKGAPAFG